MTGRASAIPAGLANESSLTVFFVVANNNAALFSAPPAVAANGTLTNPPASNANGVATVTVTLKDNEGTGNGGMDTSTPQMFVITLNAVNDAPVLVPPPPQTITELATLSLQVTATDSDIPTNTLAFALLAGPAGPTILANGAIL